MDISQSSSVSQKMLNHKIDTKVDVNFKENHLIIGISGVVTVRTLDVILKEIAKVKEHPISVVTLDLSEISMIKLGGVCHLVCLCSFLVRNSNITLQLYLRRPPDKVLSYLTTLGFFTQLSIKADLLGCEDLVHFEQERKNRTRKRTARSAYGTSLDNDSRPNVWPMETIPQKGDSIATRDFENACLCFVNNAANTFEALFSSSRFNFNEGNRHDFWQSNIELYKNIFEHSNSSLGIGTIHANPRNGTIVCYHDIGIGIKGSIHASPKIKEKIETDYDAIKWALVEGNSSKIDGSGKGLHIVEDFVLKRNGVLEIRSGACLLQRKTREADWKPYSVPWFPGTQINFFIPCRR